MKKFTKIISILLITALLLNNFIGIAQGKQMHRSSARKTDAI